MQSAVSTWVVPTILTHPLVRLVPLEESHLADLAAAAVEGSLWRSWYSGVPGPGTTAGWIREALAEREEHGACPFSIVEQETNRIVGSTRFFNVDSDNRALEIGHTWLAASMQGRGLNLATKLLMLTYAFDELGAMRVEFRAHCHNHTARTALERLGAQQDGVLRRHRRLPDGSFRDTIVYSVLADEWPAVRTRLLERLAG